MARITKRQAGLFFVRMIANIDKLRDDFKMFYHYIQFVNEKGLTAEFMRYVEKECEIEANEFGLPLKYTFDKGE